MTRRQILVASVATLAVAASAPWGAALAPALAENGEVFADDRILGNPDAPVTIIEYASLTCPHCAHFHSETLPDLKKNWIETGKARLVYRDFPLDGLALRAATLATCMEGDRYFNFLDALYKSQSQWARSSDPVAALGQMARLAGMDDATFQKCSSDKDSMNKILTRQQNAQEVYQINSTPSFVVNGQKITGSLGLEQFEEILNQAADS